jgi:hypothetical protein
MGTDVTGIYGTFQKKKFYKILFGKFSKKILT